MRIEIAARSFPRAGRRDKYASCGEMKRSDFLEDPGHAADDAFDGGLGGNGLVDVGGVVRTQDEAGVLGVMEQALDDETFHGHVERVYGAGANSATVLVDADIRAAGDERLHVVFVHAHDEQGGAMELLRHRDGFDVVFFPAFFILVLDGHGAHGHLVMLGLASVGIAGFPDLQGAATLFAEKLRIFAIDDPVRIEVVYLILLDEPAVRDRLAPLGIGNAGLADVEHLGDLDLGPHAGGLFDAIERIIKAVGVFLQDGFGHESSVTL
ncbi:hypothetical protein DSECCO2_643140 [anaerobic digester metagenome]